MHVIRMYLCDANICVRSYPTRLDMISLLKPFLQSVPVNLLTTISLSSSTSAAIMSKQSTTDITATASAASTTQAALTISLWRLSVSFRSSFVSLLLINKCARRA
jgi:hypothetical protein